MGPVLSNLYRGIEADPKATEEERKNAGKGIAGEAWLSFDNVWGRGSILNPKSTGVARIRQETDTEFNTHFNDHVERPLWRYIREVPDPTIVQYNPLAAEDPFSILKQGTGEYLSQSGFEHAKRKAEETLVSRLNDAWKVRANGRTPSDAHSWARQFHRQFFTKPAEETTAPATPPVTSNEPVVISDEDFQSFLDGKKTPQQILEGQERRGN